jgi:hypothetical protein
MTRIYIGENGSDKNDGLTKRTVIYSWKRAKKIVVGHVEISVDSASTRMRLMRELFGKDAWDRPRNTTDHHSSIKLRESCSDGLRPLQTSPCRNRPLW